MKSAYYYGIKDIRVEEHPIYEIGDGDVLVKMGATSVCGTDLRIYNAGHFKIPQGQKRVLGHEFSGQIVRTGSKVVKFKEGMRVSAAPNVGCGTCSQCIRGNNNLCPDYHAFGIDIDGGFQEYIVLPEKALNNGNVFQIPDSLSYEEAALVEPLSCVYNGYSRLKTHPGDTVIVIGAGPIGALHVALSRNAGATKVMVADINEGRLESIKQFGADVTINTSEKDLYKEVMKETDGAGADVVIVACSVAKMQQAALTIAARDARINFFGGLPEGRDNVELQTNLMHYRQLCLYATTGSTLAQYETSLKLVSSGRINVKPLISRKYHVSETSEAFAYAATGAGMKVIVTGE